jgi:hypothetical protein
MGYTNPQRIIDKSFDVFTEGSKRWVGQIAKTSAQIQERNALEKEQQKEQWEKQNEEQQKMYSSVNEIGSTGNSALDENTRGYLNDNVDKYFEIKNLMDNGKVSQADGNKELANLKNDVVKFKSIVPYLAEQTNLQREHGKIALGTAGAISSVTSGESQGILGNIITGGNTAIVKKNGIMYLYNPPIAGQQKGGMMNLDELAAKQAAGEDIVTLVPDISGDLAGAYKNIFNPDDVNSEYISLETVDLADGNTYSYKKFKTERFNPETNKMEPFDAKEYGMQAMIDAGQFDPIIANEKAMKSVWQDMMPDDITGDTEWGFVDPALDGDEAAQQAALDEQATQAKEWMAQQAYDNNSEMDNVLKYVSKKKTPTEGGGGGGGGSTTHASKAAPVTKDEFDKGVKDKIYKKGDWVWVDYGGKIGKKKV